MNEKVDAPLSSADFEFLLNPRREAKFVVAFFYEPRSWYIANQSGSAKETVSPKIGENIDMLVYFICVGTPDRILVLIQYQSSLSNYDEST